MIALLLFGALLSRPVEVSADKLEVEGRERKAVYRGNARAVRDTTTLTCDTLTVFYSQQREVQRIEALGNVEAIDGDKHAWGERAEFDNASGVLKVFGKPRVVQGARRVEGEEIVFTTGVDRVEVAKARTSSSDEQLTIDADRLVLDQDRQTARWEGHVKAKKATTSLFAPTLVASYDERGEVTRVQANGGVEVRDRDRWAKGQRADYDVPNGRLVVSGSPEARQGNNHVTGTRVTFVSGSDVLEVENAKSVIDVKDRPK